MHSGDFDNDYYTNTGAGTVTNAYMYVCAIDPNGALGHTGAVSNGGNIALRRITFNSDGILTVPTLQISYPSRPRRRTNARP
jgi:hypothetical protein